MELSMFRKIMAVAMLAAMSIVAAVGASALPQQAHFKINTPFVLKGGDDVLPAGKYTLRQVEQDNPHLFALMSGEGAPPLARLYTKPLNYPGVARHTELLLSFERNAANCPPALVGWKTPDTPGYWITAVVMDKRVVPDEVLD